MVKTLLRSQIFITTDKKNHSGVVNPKRSRLAYGNALLHLGIWL